MSAAFVRSPGIHETFSFCRRWWPYLPRLRRAVWTDFLGTLLGARRGPESFPHRLERHVERRDDENADERRQDHAAEDGSADIAPRELRGADSHDQRQQTKDEGQGRHHHGPEAQASAFRCGLENWNSLRPFLLRELDDEDAVLGRKPDEDDHADLAVEIERQPSDDDRRKRSENAD